MGWWFIPCYTVDYDYNGETLRKVVELPHLKEYLCSSCGGSYGIF